MKVRFDTEYAVHCRDCTFEMNLFDRLTAESYAEEHVNETGHQLTIIEQTVVGGVPE